MNIGQRLEAIEHHLSVLTAPAPEPMREPTPPQRFPMPVGRTVYPATIMALRHLLKPVPDDYCKVGVDRAWVACVCRRGHILRPGFVDCPCGRTFVFTGRSVHVIPLDA